MPGRGGGPRGPSPRQAGLQEVARRHFASEGPWQEAREGEVSSFFCRMRLFKVMHTEKKDIC